MKRLSPVVIGGTAAMAMQHPTTIAGNVYALAVCSPSYPGTLPLAIPGVIQGVLRLDPVAFGWLQFGVLDASGQTAPLSFAVPNDPLLVSASFDVQGMDLDAAGLITLADDELETEVAAPPPASLNMVAIAPGTFQMGSPVLPLGASPYYNDAQSQPVHSVGITRPFWMARYEVTQGEYVAVMGSNPTHPSWVAANKPVMGMTWFEAVAYCDALSAQEASAGRLPTGYEYRLPTEAEWEYCCRAGTTTEYGSGQVLVCGQESFGFSYHTNQNCISPWLFPGPEAVGSYPANAFGLHDLPGNASEWCLDAWNQLSSYAPGPVVDPYQPTGTRRSFRGGTWDGPSSLCRSAARFDSFPYNAYFTRGFRVVCAPALP